MVVRGGPTLFWLYHSERAGHFMDLGLMWSQSRQVDDLPQVRNAPALDAAIVHLQAAASWQPDIAYTYRMLGQSYAARHDWIHAAKAFEQAARLAPRNPLAKWEAGLVYEQMWYALIGATTDTLTGTLAQGQLHLPPEFDRAALCNKVTRNCPIGQIDIIQSYAGFTEGSSKVRFLILTPPVSIGYSLLIPQDRPALRFLLGRDPAVAGPAVNATYHVWIETGSRKPQEVYSRVVTAATLKSGWVADQVDLGGWVGEVVTLRLGITLDAPTPSTGTGYGWGDIALTTTDAGRLAVLAPEARVRAEWHAAGFDTSSFLNNGDTAFQQAQFTSAFAWYKRILTTQGHIPYDVLFRSAIAASLADSPEAAALQARVHDHDGTFGVHVLKDDISIDGAQLYWLTPVNSKITYGTSLTYGAGPTTFGYFWGVGQGALLLSVEQEGHYHVTMRVQQGIPPPVEMALGIDGQQRQQVSLQRGDNSWETVTMAVNLKAGLHTINIWFLNEGFVGGRSRSAVLESIKILKDRS